MAPKEESSDSTATSAPAAVHPKQDITRWRTAEERAKALRTKKQRRRAAHRIALGRSHTNG
jgi:hypothetical protein